MLVCGVVCCGVWSGVGWGGVKVVWCAWWCGVSGCAWWCGVKKDEGPEGRDFVNVKHSDIVAREAHNCEMGWGGVGVDTWGR